MYLPNTDKKTSIAYLLFLITCLFVFACSDNEINTLNKTLYDKATYYEQQGEKYRQTNPDSALIYFEQAITCLTQEPEDDSATIIKGFVYNKIAAVKYDQGIYDESRHFDSLATESAKISNNDHLWAHISNTKGLLNYVTGEYDSALIYYQRAIILAKKVGDARLLPKTYTNMGIIHYIRGNTDSTTFCFKKSLEMGVQNKDTNLIAGISNNLALLFYNSGDYDSALVYYQKALDLALIQGVEESVALYTQNAGNVFFAKCDFAKATEYYKEALNKYIRLNNRPGIARINHNLGETNLNVGNYDEAIVHFIESIKWKEEIDDKEGIALTLQSLGNIHLIQKNYQKSLEYFMQSLHLSDQLGNISKQAKNYNNIANVYDALDKTDSSLYYHKRALDIQLENGLKDGIAFSYTCLGHCSLKKNDYPMALEYFLKSLRITIFIEDHIGKCINYCNLSEVYVLWNQKQPDSKYRKKALFYAHKALYVADSLKNLSSLKASYLALKNSYAINSNYKEALNYADKFKWVDDSLMNISRTEKIVQADVRWNTEKKQRMIEHLEQQKQLQGQIIIQQKLANQRNRLIIVVLGFTLIIIVILIIAFSLIRKRRQELVFQKQLAHIANLRLLNIRNRMSPHFFFNALGSIKELSAEPVLLQQKINDLSLLLRKTIENIDQITVPIKQELSVVEAYVELYKEKFDGKLRFEVLYDESMNLEQVIPSMILQIPVENALKHGLLPLKGDERRLKIEITQDQKGFCISVIDNGVGLHSTKYHAGGTGSGLKVIMQTIHLFNLENEHKMNFNLQDMSQMDAKNRGTKAEIKIPAGFKYSTK
jgi:tetratricopeptide (TPR) repeat protein